MACITYERRSVTQNTASLVCDSHMSERVKTTFCVPTLNLLQKTNKDQKWSLRLHKKSFRISKAELFGHYLTLEINLSNSLQ